MTRAGYRSSVHASDQRAAQVEEDQFTLGEGPSVDAFGTARPVLAVDLEAAPWVTRWPLFGPLAARASYRAALAFPLLAGAHGLGVLTVYGTAPARLGNQRLTLALSAADQLTMTLLDGAEDERGNGADNGPSGVTSGKPAQSVDGWAKATPGSDAADPLGEIVYRAEIYQASGMIMAQANCTIDEAMIRLRAYAFTHDEPLHEVARRVVHRELRFSADA
jgi:hypothetical protein